MTELTTYYGFDSFIFLTVFSVISFLFFLVFLVLHWVDHKKTLQEIKINHKKSLQEVKTLSFIDGYADSMVHEYFRGFLKKIVLDPRSETDGLYNKIMLYKEIEKLEDEDFPFHKIFIIICGSGYVAQTLEEIDNKNFKARKPLEISISNGTESTSTSTSGLSSTNSSYMIPVYKVQDPYSKVHISVAIGPPLFTLRDASEEDPELKNNKKKIIEMFYYKLKKKLAENPKFFKSYELVLYNDDPDKPPTLADEIILRHVDKGLMMQQGALEYLSNMDSVNETSRLF